MIGPFWDAVCRLERHGFKVLAITCDGLSANRRLIQLHASKGEVIHKTRNPYTTEERDIFFFVDPPHLLKTTRNAWANKLRNLWVSHLNNVHLLNRPDTLIFSAFTHSTLTLNFSVMGRTCHGPM